MYIETAGTGGGCSRSCARRRARKPVVILKGGRTRQGTMAAASHTGSLAGDDRAWVALSRQTGCVLVETLDEFLDTLLTFQALTPRPQQPDAARGAVRQRRRRERARDRFFRPLRLRRGAVRPGGPRRARRAQAAAGNQHHQPGRYPVGTLQQDDGGVAEKILEIIYGCAQPEALVMHLNLSAFVGRTQARGARQPDGDRAAGAGALSGPGAFHPGAALRRRPAARRRASASSARGRCALGIPVYDELANAAHALAALQARALLAFKSVIGDQ